MSNFTQIASRPIKSGCNFNALNPIIYRFQREDANFDMALDDAGLMQVRIFGLDMSSYYEVGNQVYVEGIGLTEVTAVSLAGGTTYVTINEPFTGTAVGFINNLSKRQDYKLEVGVWNGDGAGVLGPVISTDFNQAGEAFVDISGVVVAYVAADWSLPADASAVESTTAKRVYIKYQEFYDNTYWEQISDEETNIVGVIGFINLVLGSVPNFTRYQHGGNLLGFFPMSPAKKWLTRFTRLSMWRGWPFTVSVLYSQADISFNIIQTDEAGSTTKSTSTNVVHEADRVVRLNLGSSLAEWSVLAATTKMVMNAASGLDKFLEDITVDIKDPCSNPVLLFWKNSLGGDALWMFDESQDYEYTYPSGRKVKRLTLYADNLRADEWDAINELNSPSQVIASNIVDYGMDNSIDKTHFRNDNQVYIVSQTGEKLGVIVIADGSKTRSIQRKHAIEITIELPEFYTV